MTGARHWQDRGKLAIEVLAPAVALPPRPLESVFALLIGVGTFGPGIPSLPGAIRDVSALHLALSSGHYGRCHSQLLTNPNQAQVQDAMLALCTQSQRDPSATILILLATHGLYRNGAYHLCLRESQSVDGHIDNAMPFATWRDWCAPLQTHPLVLLLDSCRHIPEEDTTASASWICTPEGRDDIALPGHQWAVVTASAPGQASWEAPGEAREAAGATHGLFTEALLQELAHPRKHGTRTLRIGAIHEGIRERMAQRLEKLPGAPTQTPTLYANFTRDIRIGERALALEWAALQETYCAQIQFGPVHALPLPLPPAGTCLLRPKEAKETAQWMRQDLATLVLSTGIEGFAHGEWSHGDDLCIVIQEAPTLDDMLAATGLFLLSHGYELPDEWASIASYAHRLRRDPFAATCPAETSLAGLFTALAARADLTQPQGSAALIHAWCRVFEAWLWQCIQPQEAGQISPSIDPFCPGDEAFAEARTWLAQDRSNFDNDRQRSREWAETQAGVKLPAGVSLLIEPACVCPHMWFAQEPGLNEGALKDGMLCLLSKERWMFCVAPSQPRRLHQLQQALQPHEKGGPLRLLEGLPLPTLASPASTTLSHKTILRHLHKTLERAPDSR